MYCYVAIKPALGVRETSKLVKNLLVIIVFDKFKA